MKKRCICGRSSSFPVCDGSHSAQGWACSSEQTTSAGALVLASGHYLSFADKWAHQIGALHTEKQSGVLRCKELWILCDGSDVERLILERQRISAVHTRLIAIDCNPLFLSCLGAFSSVYHLKDDGMLSLWTQLLKLDSFEECTQEKALPNIFVSHAVADERMLLPAVSYMRKYFDLQLFFCCDSIRQGANWFETIQNALRDADRIFLAISKAFLGSTFCAFEVGMARALHKEISLFCIDDSIPPAYIQEVQALSLPRLMAQKPWLNQREAIIEMMMQSAFP